MSEGALRTGWEPATESIDTLTLAAVRTMGDRIADWALAAGGQIERADGLLLADARSNCMLLNQAVSTAPMDVALAQRVLAFFGPARPFVLFGPRPAGDLTPTGLQLMGHPPLMVRAAGGTAPTLPPGVTVKEVTDPAELPVWDEVAARGFGVAASPSPPALVGSVHRFWIGRYDGVPAAVAAATTDHGVNDVEMIATLEEHRGRGLGAAVTWAATLADRALPAVLISSDLGRPVYERMGYLAVTRWTMWYRP